MERCTEACGTRLLLLLRYGILSVGQLSVTEMLYSMCSAPVLEVGRQIWPDWYCELWYRMRYKMWAGKYGLIDTVKCGTECVLQDVGWQVGPDWYCEEDVPCLRGVGASVTSRSA